MSNRSGNVINVSFNPMGDVGEGLFNVLIECPENGSSEEVEGFIRGFIANSPETPSPESIERALAEKYLLLRQIALLEVDCDYGTVEIVDSMEKELLPGAGRGM